MLRSTLGAHFSPILGHSVIQTLALTGLHIGAELSRSGSTLFARFLLLRSWFLYETHRSFAAYAARIISLVDYAATSPTPLAQEWNIDAARQVVFVIEFTPGECRVEWHCRCKFLRGNCRGDGPRKLSAVIGLLEIPFLLSFSSSPLAKSRSHDSTFR